MLTPGAPLFSERYINAREDNATPGAPWSQGNIAHDDGKHIFSRVSLFLPYFKPWPCISRSHYPTLRLLNISDMPENLASHPVVPFFPSPSSVSISISLTQLIFTR